MKSILTKLFKGNNLQATEHILDIYNKKGFCIVDYIYFSPIVSHKLFSNIHLNVDPQKFETALLDDYKTIDKILEGQISALYKYSLLSSDILLPDGIALQTFNYLANHKRLHNLNGTDFCPYFLDYIKEKYGSEKINIILYGTYQDLLNKTKHYLENKGFNIKYSQDGYSNLNRDEISNNTNKSDVNILLLARTTVQYPIQEIRTQANLENIEKYKLIVMNQGGTFDFWAGKQKRAPHIIRKIKLEWLRRLILDPKRNWRKVKNTIMILPYILYYLLLKKK